MSSESSRVQEILEDLDDGDELVFDPYSKTIRPASYASDPDRTMKITPEDREFFTAWR